MRLALATSLALLALVQPAFAQSWEPGVDVQIFQVGGELERLPELIENQTPNYHARWSRMSFLEGRDDIGGLTDHYIVVMTARLEVPTSGSHAFRLESDDGSILLLDGAPLIDNDGLHGPLAVETAVALEAGPRTLEVRHFENGGGAMVELSWRPPGASDWTVLSEAELTTPRDIVRPTSPGEKRVLRREDARAFGDARPLRDVHPGYDLLTCRPEGFEPKVGGIAFLADGRMLVSCWEPDGGVYLLDGIHGDDRAKITVERIASGLAEPLGLVTVGSRIFVLQKQELTELLDTDGDEIIDEYRCLSDAWHVTANFHEFAFGLVEQDGWLYFNLAIAINPGGASTKPQIQDRGRTVRVHVDTGEREFLTWGLRTPNGIGEGPDGGLFLTDNQGDWLPSSKVLHLETGAFYNSFAALPEGWTPRPVSPPVVWMPQNEIGNSPGEPALFRGGPFAGQLAVSDVTHGGIKRVFLEKIGGRYQGALFRFTQGLEAGVNRLKILADGSIFAGGIGSDGNWGQEGKRRFGLQRLRPNGASAFEMLAVRARTNGFEIDLTEPLRLDAPLDRIEVQSFRYEPTPQYGGPKVDLTAITPRSVSVAPDRRRIFVEVDAMVEGRVWYLKLPSSCRSEDHRALWATECWYTLNAVPENEVQQPWPSGARVPENELTQVEKAAGWTSLFDGRSAAHWRIFRGTSFPERGWIVRDGALIHEAGGGGGDVITRETYGDFEFQCEWRIAAGGNSGIMYRVVEDAPQTYASGPEMQILDDVRHHDGTNTKTSSGALYALVACRRPAVRPVGEWNHVRIRLDDGRLTHWLNGVEVVDIEWNGAEWRELVAASKFAAMPLFGKADRGHIALQDHGDEVAFRNLKVRRLD